MIANFDAFDASRLSERQREIIGMIKLVHTVDHCVHRDAVVRIVYVIDHQFVQIINVSPSGYLVSSRITNPPEKWMLIDPTPEGIREMDYFLNVWDEKRE